MDAPNQGQSKVKGVVHTWYQFSTKSLSSWNDLQALWYVNGVKVVPQNIFEMLTPISLAYWVCDDGWGKKWKRFPFCHKCFYNRRCTITY